MKRRIIDAFARPQSVLVASHRDPDGDALGSSLGLARILSELGKQVTVFSAGPIPPEYGFLPGVERIASDAPPMEGIDLAVLLDCHEPGRAGEKAAVFLPKARESVVIDHHRGEALFGEAAWVDPSYAATSEMLAELTLEAGWPLPPDASGCFFVGIQTDTGSFRYSNTSPRALTIAARLVEAGADPWAASQHVYATRPKRLKLLAWVLDGLETDLGGKLALGRVSQQDLARLGCDSRDLEDAAEAIRGIPGVEAAALLRERPDGGVKASMRSRGGVDVSRVALGLGGGGHKNAAGMMMPEPLDQAAGKVMQLLAKAMREQGL